MYTVKDQFLTVISGDVPGVGTSPSSIFSGAPQEWKNNCGVSEGDF